MSLSTCDRCGGHIPLGPDASNRCESCGLGVFGTMASTGNGVCLRHGGMQFLQTSTGTSWVCVHCQIDSLSERIARLEAKA